MNHIRQVARFIAACYAAMGLAVAMLSFGMARACDARTGEQTRPWMQAAASGVVGLAWPSIFIVTDSQLDAFIRFVRQR